MRLTETFAHGDDYSVDDVRIRADHESWLPTEWQYGYRLVFVRCGTYRLRVDDLSALVHPVLAYLVPPRGEQQIAHSSGVTDTCTSITVSEALMSEIVGGRPPRTAQLIVTSGRIDLMHRMLVSRARGRADDFEVLERVIQLTASLAGQVAGLNWRVAGKPSTAAARLTDAARALLAENPEALSLSDTARQLGVSSPYLSRTFKRCTGMSLTRFRNQMRVRRVLDSIESGQDSLSGLAAELGFSDHAHMTRMVRDSVGHPPATLRELLTAASAR